MVLRVVSIINIVVIVILVLITLSRTGLACIVLLLAISFARVIKRHFYKGIIVLAILTFAVSHYATDFVDKEYALLYERLFERSDNLESAGELRSELSKQNIRFIIDNPSYLLFGLGPSATASNNAKDVPGLIQYRKSHYRDHNSWSSCFSEYGLFAFVLFFLLVFSIVKRVIRMNHSVTKYICVGTCLSIIIFSLSIWQMTYLPFWWGLFLLGNKQLQDI
jgi:O-antigen ligase